MKNILVTGGAGFIGSRLSLELVGKGYVVTVLDNLLQQVHGENPEVDSPLYKSIVGQVRFIKGDVVNTEDWENALVGQDIIVHLAAETGTGQSMYEIGKHSEVNVSGTAKMLDLLVNNQHNIKKVIVASSRAVYGEGKYSHPHLGVVFPPSRKVESMMIREFEMKHEDGRNLTPVPTDETSKINPISIYGITKYTQEQMVMLSCSSIGVPAVSLRFQNVYGEGQSLANPYTGILSIFSTQILNGEEINVFEDGKESRDFIHVEDVVSAILMSIENEAANGEVFNIGTGVSTSVKEVAETLASAYGKQVPIKISGLFRVGDIRHNFADTSKAQKILGFNPKITFKEGISKFTSWVSAQSVSTIRVSDSLNEMKSKGLLK